MEHVVQKIMHVGRIIIKDVIETSFMDFVFIESKIWGIKNVVAQNIAEYLYTSSLTILARPVSFFII